MKTAAFMSSAALLLISLTFWTNNEFAVAFRKMLMLEQYKSPEKMKQYQEMICEGPVKYSEDLLSAMIKEDKLNDKAKALPTDAVILTAGCAKYKYNKLDLGDIGGIP